MTEPYGDSPDGWREEIDELLRMIAELVGMEAAAPPAERPALAGLRGMLRVEVYELDPQVGGLDLAVAELAASTRDAASHPDVALWHHALAFAHRRRAALRESPDEFRQAIACLHTVLSHAPHPELDADVVSIQLAEVHCQLFHASGGRGLDAIDRLITELGRITLTGDDPVPGDYLSMLRGEACLSRFGHTGERGDLDAAIELLAPAVPRLPADVPELSEAGYDLAYAYRSRYEREDDPDDLDRAVETSSAAALRTGDGDPYRPLLRELHGDCLFARWRARRDLADLDAAIASLLDAMSSEQPPPLAAECLADAYAARAEARADTADWRHSASWYARAAQAGGTDSWTLLAGQAHAHLELHSLTRDHADLTDAMRSLSGLIAYPDLDDEPCLEAHHARMTLVLEWADPRFTEDPTSVAPDVLRMAEEAEDALRARAGAPLAARAALALRVFQVLAKAVGEGQPHDFGRMLSLLRLVAQQPDATDGDRRLVAALATQIELLEDAFRYSGEGGYGMDLSLPEQLDLDEAPPELVDALRGLAVINRLLQALQRGDIRGLQEGVEQLTSHAAGTPKENDAVVLAALIGLNQCFRAGDLHGAGTRIDVALAELAAAPQATWADRVTVSMLHEFRRMLDVAGLAGSRDPAPHDNALWAAYSSGPYAGILTGMRLAQQYLAARRDGDIARAKALLDELGSMIAQRGPDDPLRLSLSGAAVTLAESPEFDGDESMIERSVGWAQDGLDLAGGPWHPQWGRLALSLANALRRRGWRGRGSAADRADSRRAGLRALHGHAWQALLQSGTDDAMTAARDAADVALTVARWCMADAAAAPAPQRAEVLHEVVRALDSGRGLVLHAATSSRRVEDMLRDGGHPDLAVEWGEQHTGPYGAHSGDLRYRVLRALAPERDAAQEPDPLLDPPTVADIGRALRHSGGDVLVYLFAGSGDTGHAVIVTADANVSALPLPQLRDDATELTVYLAAHDERHRAADDADLVGWRAALSEVCRWAWTAAIGDILRQSAVTWSPTPRLVLVPMGALGLVPWPAAWRMADGVRRHAVSDAVFSVVASARLLCDVVAREPVTGGAALVVGDPGDDLAAAGAEARAIHQRFYPTGTYLGQPPGHGQGQGTAAEVTDWLLAQPGPRSFVHIAGHGTVDAGRPADSCLHLAKGEQLRIRDLVEQTRGTQREIGAVWLAACTTGMAGAFYDESLSLATAFLAAGARSVYGSMWLVPDRGTSLLMFMSHHFLRENPGDAAEALRRAQLWMLDQDRVPPKTMPPDLAKGAKRRTAADPAFWAGFLHLGTSAAVVADQGPHWTSR